MSAAERVSRFLDAWESDPVNDQGVIARAFDGIDGDLIRLTADDLRDVLAERADALGAP